jgi:hypothetical protein
MRIPGPDRADDLCPARGGPARQDRRRAVDLLGFILEAKAGELHRIRPEGVRLDDLRPRLHVFPVDPLDEPRLREVQRVVTDIHEDAPFVEQGPDGSVEQMDGAVLDQFSERFHRDSLLPGRASDPGPVSPGS